MYSDDLDSNTIATSFQGRFRSYASGFRYGMQYAVNPADCPPIARALVGPSLTQFEAAAREGFAHALRLKAEQEQRLKEQVSS